ncbi:MAG: hypothetical protein OXE78_15020 [Gammaproteobacteria bacterium]|nr:hypothetical protein [Gammaproteobacteria bacterium]MCY4358282.1 hypothetical protein [Gammaproteobacteria bacterium]
MLQYDDIESKLIRGLDVSELRTATEKSEQIMTAEVKSVNQLKQLENPDSRILLSQGSDLPLPSKYAKALVGLQTSDDPMFIIAFWKKAD